MDQPTETCTILFADIAKSTHLYEVAGDETAKNLIGRIITRLAEITRRHFGEVVKTIGDEIMCTFATPDSAVAAAREMHESMTGFPVPDAPPGFGTPNLYVGFHQGPVIREDNDVFGDAVNVAARMVSMAKPRQILTTEETVDTLSPGYRDFAECVDKTVIKGKTGTASIYEIIWERQDLTVMVDSLMDSQSLRFRLELKLGDRRMNVDQSCPSATFGRQPHNDFVVDDSRVSRTHARVEYRRGRFILIDQSSNGTYVLDSLGKVTKLKREEVPLLGSGTIFLGRKPESDLTGVIEYAIKH